MDLWATTKNSEIGKITPKTISEFSALFGRNDFSQIVKEDIPHYWVGVRKPK